MRRDTPAARDWDCIACSCPSPIPHQPQQQPHWYWYWHRGACCVELAPIVKWTFAPPPACVFQACLAGFGCRDTLGCVHAHVHVIANSPAAVAAFQSPDSRFQRHHFRMDAALVDFLAVAQLAWWPISKCIFAVQVVLSLLLHVVIRLLSPFWIVGSFLLLPFVHLARGLFHVVTFPLQVKWLERIEVCASVDRQRLENNTKGIQTLYIYLGTAGIIGCLTGAVLYFIFNLLSPSISNQPTPKPKPRETRTTADFRNQQRGKREERLSGHSGSSRVIVARPPASKRSGLLSQSIVEEEDSDI